MYKRIALSAALAVLLGLAAVSAAQARGHGHGPMMMGNSGPMMMGGNGPCMAERAKPLTTVQVKDIIEGHIAWHGEDFTVGTVEQAKDGIIRAEILKPDGSVDHTVQVEAKTGRFLSMTR